MKIINLTPHEINIIGEDNKPLATIKPSGTVARVTEKFSTVDHIGEIPVTTVRYGNLEGLPEPGGDTVYIVSAMIANGNITRQDLYYPGQQVRDDKGRVIGCRSLVMP